MCFSEWPEIVNVHSDEATFYPYSVRISKCSGSCTNINNPYAILCVPDFVKNINLKVFNLISRTNETRYMKFHKTCKCKYRLNASVCNNINKDGMKIKADVNEKNWLIKVVVIKELFGSIVIECEYDKLCDTGEYLDYENGKCRKKLVDKLVEEYTENVDEKEIYPEKLHSEEIITPVCSSFTIYTYFFLRFLK